MKIGVFSDDAAGTAVALMVVRGLASIGEQADVLTPEPGRGAVRSSGDVPVPRAARPSMHAIARSGENSHDQSAHLVVVLPLDALNRREGFEPLDVILTAGRDHPASARALRAARYAAVPFRAPSDNEATLSFPPAWFVPCSHQVDLWTKATLASTGAVSLPFATRAIPFMVPRLGPDGITDPEQIDAQLPLLRTAVLLASVVTAIAADPLARSIDAAGMAALMSDHEKVGRKGVGKRLLALAAEYERLDSSASSEEGRRHLPPSSRRRPRPSFPPASLRRRYADIAKGRTDHFVR